MLETVDIVIGIIVGLIALISVAIAVLRWIRGRRQRPELEVHLDEQSLTQGIKHDNAPCGYALFLRFLISNTGNAAAHNVKVWLGFDTNHLDPLMYVGGSTVAGGFKVSRINENQVRLEADTIFANTGAMSTEVRVAVMNIGPTQIRHQVKSDTETISEGTLSLNVPEPSQAGVKIRRSEQRE